MKSKRASGFVLATMLCLVILENSAHAAPPSINSQIGDTVINPLIEPSDPPTDPPNNEAFVTGLNLEDNFPDTSVLPYPQFVFTNQSIPETEGETFEYSFMVRDVGDVLYQYFDGKLYTSEILSITSDPAKPYESPIFTVTDSGLTGFSLVNQEIKAWDTYSEWLKVFAPWAGGDGAELDPVISGGVDGVSYVKYGAPGAGGSTGFLLIPAGSGKPGKPGPDIVFDTNILPLDANPQPFPKSITATNKVGLKVGSVGGNGGNGGSVYLSPFSGAKGGNAGKGGDVTVIVQADVEQIATTSESEKGLHGIFAFSRSGAGGKGGSGYAAVGGGSGGGSPNGGDVTIKNSALLVSTDSEYGYGIYALSVSGQGGSGGDQYGIAGYSGSGAAPANGGDVKIENYGQVVTRKEYSYGILAQSIGGGGGSSGSTGNLIYSDTANGQAGGDGGKASVINAGRVSTQADYSQGIAAQSIGGGGGNSGSSWGLVAIGGTADNGGRGDTVSVENTLTGSVQTRGKGSIGIFAQSVGGSGGRGGDATGLAAIGGNGAVGGGGGRVDVTNAGEIKTFGDTSRGIFAESVGGGGGSGGSSVGMVAVGGTGAGGGDGNNVSVVNSGTITTAGDYSEGIYAQSVGGGGGDGGTSTAVGAFLAVAVGGDGATGGKGGEVDIILGGESPSIIKTGADEDGGYKSVGVFAQSVGGGGGSGGGALSVSAGLFGSVSVSLGGKGAKGGDGGLVNLTTPENSQNTIVSTKGNDSTGVYLQSVGGGGGDGGYAYSFAAAAGPVSGTVNVGIGGRGGKGGEGGVVTVGSGFAADPTIDDVPISPTSGFRGAIYTDGERSTGLFAQSVGGGGGNGGLAISAGISASAGGSLGVSVGLGGDGGAAGNGGVVKVATEGDITTNQAQSTALLVQSVGGGGGNGGGTVTAGVSASGGAAATINVGGGGEGAAGGDGGEVTLVTGDGNILTKGIRAPDPELDPDLDAELLSRITGGQSPGIIVQSIGGGGGNGGYAVAAGIAGAGGAAGAVTVSLGGGGGSGGDGGKVFAQLASNVTTEGDSSAAILVQSVGGGGGNGGFSVSAAGAGAGGGAGAIAVGLGGSGAEGGVGGEVIATSSGEIITKGTQSTGFTAQSIGGGGGNGGFNVSGGLSGAGTGSGAISVGLGGDGGAGNDAGNVIAETTGKIMTFGAQSTGVLAQSVGGGGGNGGYNISAAGSAAGTGSGAVSVGLGGSGKGGGNGGDVDLTVSETVYTEREQSVAVIAQSIGGGGGNGGYNISAVASGAGTGSGTVGVGLGGSGAGGGDGGEVVVSTSSNIWTKGVGSGGILAQSVGGGGGNGGFNVTVSGSGAGTGSGAVGVGLGGSGEGGGNASTVDLTVENNVTTTLRDSSGIVAQSIGGGGGSGGFNVTVAGSGAGTGSGAVSVGLGGSAGTGGFARAVTSKVTGNIVTGGDDSTGLLVQSVGGGGGNGGFSVSAAISGAGTGSASAAVGLGGSGGSGGISGTVESTLTGDVRTAGKNATAVIAQSIGGGGGKGGMSVAGAISGAKTGSAAASVSVGGSGGGGGDSNTVENTVTGHIVTAESGSGGILAQSVGGGGGEGGISVSGTISVASTGTGAVSVGIGGSGGDGGDSMKVTNAVTGTVFTSGPDASGIVAQSLGGGGGNGGINVTGTISAAKTGAGAIGVGIGGSGGGGGDSGEVDNTVEGYVQTTGDNSAGIFAQSLGGGGGNGGLNVTGMITAAKTGSGGLAVGIGGFGGDGGDAGKVTNKVTGGTVTTGNNADGIVAQSLGGGGGNGAINVTASVNLSKDNGGTLGVGIGGFGGDGGNAGDVISTVITTEEYQQIGTTGDDSSAVIAQSIGGGGGNGGLNITGTVNASGKNGAAIGVGVGGFGGGAGDAGDVTLGVTGTVVTEGNNSHGLIAQSIGGGGGNGGTNVTGSLAIVKPASGSSGTTVAASIGVGGFGGGGGQAGDVDLTYAGTIVAQPRILVPETVDPVSGATVPVHYEFKEGSGSYGILAQSLGGGGGNGGVNVSAGISYAAGESDGHALLVGVGGFGGSGGDAGDVSVTVTGGESISAYGNGHSAIMAQSTGGGGGNGALNVSGGIVSDSPLIVGVGGMGGNGGTAGDVSVAAATDVYAIAETDDDEHSAGIMAQSLGGGGGNGGVNISGGLSIDKGKSPSITVGVGGFGGSGAVSGDVELVHDGNAITTGGWTHGLFAQSIAGGGGNGGLNVSGQFNWADSEDSGGAKDLSIVAGIGGHGGQGADAGDVGVISTGTISTSGAYSRGIYAQSVGGGGGTGGMNVTGVFAKNSSPISMGIGGFGSGGGNAGTVQVNRGSVDLAAGKITTDGVGAIGIEASSIGGGGGDAGMNFVVGISLAKDSNNDGGDTGGDTGTTREHPKHTGVDESVFTNFDKVLDELEGRSPKDPQDEKDASKDSPFAAQIAIGGSAGDAGHGNTASVDNHGDVETRGNDSHGILAQSIGGGGGNASVNLAVTYQGKSDDSKGFNFTLGGATGDGGNGAKVELDSDGIVVTGGDDAYGLFAQSVGGGGGNVGYDFSTMQTKGGKIGINLGRQGGTGGFGDDVTLTSKGAVSTLGARSYGILAQSVGNGGGNSSSTTISGELAANEEDGTPNRAASITIGLEGGEGGSAGDVDVDVAGTVTTIGEGAHAVFAQSVGGGGGNAGDAKSKASTLAVSIGASGGIGGTGGKVEVTSSAGIFTRGQDALGILAQSIGGGGGTGSTTESKAEDFAIAIGGSGGEGAVSDTVAVINRGTIITEGAGSYGVLAQSIAGGGGNAKATKSTLEKKKPKENTTGDSSTAPTDSADGDKEESNSAVQVSIAIGGTGGTGAASGDVTVENFGGIGTSGDQAIGIFAQSIGGGGGNAAQTASSVTSELGSGLLFGLGIGGNGGTGGAAGDVTVSNLVDSGTDQAGQIITLGNESHGIFAMSIGGGGGNGSSVTAKTNAKNQNEKSAASAFSVGIGGSGGTGGTGGEVTVTNAGMIATYGTKAHGIVAQSIGGGGGNGGMTIAGNQAMGSREAGSKAGSFALGGSGGDGNASGDVSVINTGSIEVFGDQSYGIYAQSVGGGGGDGALAIGLSADIASNPLTNLAPTLMNIGIGGSGGDGGDSGNVFIDQQGSIIAHGDNAYGIYAQSVGGGGGRVGASISSPVWMAADLTISALVGGRDGSDGNAGTVTINTVGDITTTGSNSQAYFAQAVNGGGGDLQLFLDVSDKGGAYGEDSVDLEEELGFIEQIKAKVTVELGLGSSEASGASGSEIQSSHQGDVFTAGDQSVASSTQSVGGGGGNATVALVVNDEAQVDLGFLLGASESSDSSGGDVDLTRDGDVVTTGDQSQGAGVQSIGGGGGNLSVNVRKVPVQEDPAEVMAAVTPASLAPMVSPRPQDLVPAGEVTASVMLGSDLSDNNDGGDVTLATTGDLLTSGTLSPGVVIQSIGGGGGQLNLTGLDSLAISMGASGGSSGDGGNIVVANDGTVLTEGELSHGIMIQSIGGGGGAVFTDLEESAINLTLNTDNSGSGGSIDLSQTGDVVVTGDRSIAVFAQSLGGGGGAVDRLFADTSGGAGMAGSVNLTLDGNVLAEGQDGVAVFAQSRGTDGQGDINISLAEDKLAYAGANGVGVWMSGGANNSFTNRGVVMTADGILGRATIGEEGNDQIDNHGTFYGQFDLGYGMNRVVNHVDSLLVPGAVLRLGAANNQLVNDGIMIPGDMFYAQHTDLTGSFSQSATGMTYSELDFGSDILDQIYMTGTADLAGEMDVALLNPQLVPSGHYQKDLFHAELGLTDSGMFLTTAPSVVINYELLYPTGHAAVLDYNVDFSPKGMSKNLTEVGDYFNRIQSAGSSPALADTVIKLLYDPTMNDYRASLSQLSPEFYGEDQADLIHSSQQFGRTMANGGGYRFGDKDQVIWLQFDRENNTHSDSGDYKSVDHDADRYTLGFDKRLDSRWALGLSVAYEDTESDGYGGRWSSSGQTGHVGASLKHQSGNTQIALFQSYSWSDTDIERIVQVTEPLRAKARRHQDAYGGMLRLSHDLHQESIYLRPLLDLGVTYLMVESTDEKGAGGASLELESYNETHTWVRPALGMGYKHSLNAGIDMHLHANLGFQYYLSDSETEVHAGFAGAPAGVDTMNVPVELGQSYADGAVGVDLKINKQVNVGFQYSTIFDKDHDLDRYSVNLTIPF